MKRIFLFLLALLLTGCGALSKTEATEDAAVAQFSMPTTLYVADSPVERNTAGAVKTYHLPENCIDIAAMDGTVVLVTDLSRLILMDAETGELGTSIKTGERISTLTPDFTASAKGITYYRQEGNELVFLSRNLRQVQTVEIPEEITGALCISRENEEVYFDKDNGIYAQHLQSGQIRPLFSGAYESAVLKTGHLDGTVLECVVTDAEGAETTLYLDASSGDILADSQWLLTLQTDGDSYLLNRKDGIVEQTIYGTLNGESHVLNLEHPVVMLPQMHGGYRACVVNGALEIDFYDFLSGTHSSHLRLEGVTKTPVSVAADGKYIWILTEKELLRWDVTMSPTDKEESFLKPLYTRENPDADGLAQCVQRAQTLSEQYGIYVTVGEEAAAVTGGYAITAEHQVLALTQMMDELEVILQQFPEDFLRESLGSGTIHIGFVRAISGDREMVQFYQNGDAYILIAASENIPLQILHGLGYIVDSHVLGNSWVYEDWKTLNPEGFDYDYHYYAYEAHQSSPYLTYGERAFVDAYAMTFPHEDRSLLFAYAMMKGKAACFTNETMQAKLAMICEGIRDAYGYWWSDQDFPWEQYLLEK